MKYALIRQRFENDTASSSRCLRPWPAQVDELTSTSAEYVLEECEKLFERSNGQLPTLHRQRLQKLLQRIQLRFGPDGHHNHFRRLLRRALRSMNFAAAILILKDYLSSSDLYPLGDDTLDLLTQTCVWVRSHFHVQQRQLQQSRQTLKHVLEIGAGFTYLSDLLNNTSASDHLPTNSIASLNTNSESKSCSSEQSLNLSELLSFQNKCDLQIKPFDETESQFEQLVHLLLSYSRPSHCYAGYGSLLEILIRSLPSINLVPLSKHNQAERLLRICLCALLQQERLDVNPPIGWQRLHGTSAVTSDETSLLQLSIDLCHYDIATRLVQLGARINKLQVTDVLFLQTTERLFQLLYVAGYQFPPADRFKQTYSDCIRQDEPFNRFCRWLRAVQSRQLPLTCLCWNALRAAHGSDAQYLLDELEQQIAFPPDFLAYARHHALDILRLNVPSDHFKL